jgi:hypothetical protein
MEGAVFIPLWKTRKDSHWSKNGESKLEKLMNEICVERDFRCGGDCGKRNKVDI